MPDKNTKKQQLINKHAEKPHNQVRRSQYAIDDPEWLKALLKRAAFGTLGTCYQEQPFVTPVLYVYLEAQHAVYIHGALSGRMRSNIDLNPKVSLNVSEFGRIFAAKGACDFSLEYNSITLFGQASVVEEPERAASILGSLMEKYASHLIPGSDYSHPRAEDLKRTRVIEIKIESWSGKQQRQPGESWESFDYPYPPMIRYE